MPKRLVAVNESGLRIGEDHPRAKLTDAEVERLRQLHAEGIGYRRLAVIFEVNRATVRDIVKFRTRAQTPTAWRAQGGVDT